MIAFWMNASGSIFENELFATEPPITAVCFAPDGKTVLAGSQAGLKVYSWPTLQLLESLETQLVQIHDVEFSPDGKQLVAAGGAPAEQGEWELWSWPTKKLLRREAPHQDVIYAVSFHPSSKKLATASLDREIKVFQLDTMKTPVVFQGHARGVLDVSFLPNSPGTTSGGLVSGSIDFSLRVWDVDPPRSKRNLANHTEVVLGLSLQPWRKHTVRPMLVSVGDDRSVRFWQPTIGRLVRFCRLPSSPRCVGWFPNGQFAIVGCQDGFVRAIDFETTEVVFQQQVNDGWLHTLAVSPQGDAVLIGGAAGCLKRVSLKLPE